MIPILSFLLSISPSCIPPFFPPFLPPSLLSSLQASRVDKLQSELASQREKLEEAGRLQVRLREMKTKMEQMLESKATLEDEVGNLQDKVAILGE